MNTNTSSEKHGGHKYNHKQQLILNTYRTKYKYVQSLFAVINSSFWWPIIVMTVICMVEPVVLLWSTLPLSESTLRYCAMFCVMLLSTACGRIAATSEQSFILRLTNI